MNKPVTGVLGCCDDLDKNLSRPRFRNVDFLEVDVALSIDDNGELLGRSHIC